MSNRNPESSSGTLAELIAFAFEQQAKILNTMMPGVVHSYDSTTGRAVVQPSIDMLLTDGTRIEPPLISDVPILQPSVASFHLHLPVAADDTVWIMCSQRGITEYKKTLTRSPPDKGHIMSLTDAVAMPVSFSNSDRLIPRSAAVLSNPDASCHLRFSAGGDIRISCAGQLRIAAGGGVTIIGNQHTLEIP